MTREPDDFEKEIEVVEVDTQPETTAEIKPRNEEEPKEKTGEHRSSFNESEYDDFIFTKYHGRRKGIFSHSVNHNTTVSYSSKNHFVKEVSSKRKRKKPWYKKLLIILGIAFAAILALLLIAVGVFFILQQNGISQLRSGNVDMTAPIIENAGVSVDNSKNTITYNGTTYAYNSSMTSILCMGIDKRDGLGLENEAVGTGGQADALYLVALDTATGKTDVIGISRDIYSDIGVYSTDGKYTGTENAQLCLAYAYGDGKETSCENTVNAVERLFYNLPINSYFAIELDAVSELNDAVGGITVTMEDDYLYYGMGFEARAGETVHLWGEQAKNYLQYRNVDELNSSVDRMNRQLNYLEKFGKTAIDMTKKDLTTPVTLFNIVQDYSVTNLNASKISALGYTVATSGAEVEFEKVPGEVIHNGEYAQYIVDEQGMLELILDVYYTPLT